MTFYRSSSLIDEMNPSNKILEKEGDRYGDFLLVKRTPIDELQLVLREILHVPSGAQVMHLENDDPENLFCISFRTLPHSSNGAPHILEHTVLCGSREFPVKDPFFAMSRRSLNTFMNALTGSDFTCYPAATQVEKDFYNLLDVYLDAVFHPLLKEMSFLQEGHRYEFVSPEDPKSPLEIKGIVYNEMKGSVSAVDSHIWHAVMAHLVPGLPYAFNSGGDPKDIPHLSYAKLIDFYETYYHPSRSLFFFYGNLPLKKHLDFIEEKTLKHAQRLSPLPDIARQKRFEQPRHARLTYPLAESKDSSKEFIHTFSWLMMPLQNQEEVLALVVLDSVLMDTDASLLRKALLDSELCVQADSYVDTEMSEVPYVIYCRGCKEENGAALKKLLFEKLAEIARDGIPFSLVEASMHQLEFSRLEIGSDQSPFGLTLFMRSALAKQHGCDPEQALIVHSLFSSLLKKAKDPHFFTPLIEKYFLKNPHHLEITFAPDADFTAKEVEAEKKHLLEVRAKLSEKEIAKILEQTRELKDYQKHVEGQKIDCLPKVTLDDVSKQIQMFPLDVYQAENLQIFHSESFTNQILYADLLFDLPEISEKELFTLQLFSILWSEVGSGKRTYRQNLEAIHAHTGGIGAHYSLHVQATDPMKSRPALQIRGKALGRKLPQFFELLSDMVRSARFDEKKRISDLIRKLASSMRNRLTRSAMRYASQLSSSGLTIPAYIHEHWHGLTFYHKVQELAGHLHSALPKLMEDLLELKERLFTVPNPHLILSCDQPMFREIQKHHYFGLANLPSQPARHWKGDYRLPHVPSQARVISSPVAFNAWTLPAVSYAHSSSPALLVSTLLLDNKVLHHRIREQGGAYGAGATYNTLWGHYSFNSYRDPHIAHSLHTFRAAVEEMASGEFDERDLEEAKIGIIQHIDVPTSPGSKAIVAYTWQRDGKTPAMRQHFRDRLLNLTKDELQGALKEHILPNMDKGVAVSFAGQSLVDKDNAKLAEEGKALKVLPI